MPEISVSCAVSTTSSGLALAKLAGCHDVGGHKTVGVVAKQA
jgi:hypothetical protein